MKSLHRIKAISAYNGGRVAINAEENYPAYILLKESARGILSYITEDAFATEICEKTKLANLLEWTTPTFISNEDRAVIQLLVDAEKGGLQYILAIPLDDLKVIKKTLKKLIGTYLKEPV